MRTHQRQLAERMMELGLSREDVPVVVLPREGRDVEDLRDLDERLHELLGTRGDGDAEPPVVIGPFLKEAVKEILKEAGKEAAKEAAKEGAKKLVDKGIDEATKPAPPRLAKGWMKNCTVALVGELGKDQCVKLKISWNGGGLTDDPGTVDVFKDGKSLGGKITGDGDVMLRGPGVITAHLTGNEDWCWFELEHCPPDGHAPAPAPPPTP